jgi:hypothetical protein
MPAGFISIFNHCEPVRWSISITIRDLLGRYIGIKIRRKKIWNQTSCLKKTLIEFDSTSSCRCDTALTQNTESLLAINTCYQFWNEAMAIINVKIRMEPALCGVWLVQNITINLKTDNIVPPLRLNLEWFRLVPTRCVGRVA